MTPEQILVFVLIAYLLMQSILIRRDALQSVNAMARILEKQQEQAKEREEDLWKRAQFEVKSARDQAQAVHEQLLKAKMPKIIPMTQQMFPYQNSAPQQNSKNRTIRPGIDDAATMGAR